MKSCAVLLRVKKKGKRAFQIQDGRIGYLVYERVRTFAYPFSPDSWSGIPPIEAKNVCCQENVQKKEAYPLPFLRYRNLCVARCVLKKNRTQNISERLPPFLSKTPDTPIFSPGQIETNIQEVNKKGDTNMEPIKKEKERIVVNPPPDLRPLPNFR